MSQALSMSEICVSNVDEIFRRSEEIKRRKKEIEEATEKLEADKHQLRWDCPHSFDDPDGLGSWCSLCGAYQYE